MPPEAVTTHDVARARFLLEQAATALLEADPQMRDDDALFLDMLDGEGGDALHVVERGKGVHLVVVQLVPGGVPAGAVLLDAVGELEGAEVVVDGREAGHEGEVGAGDGEDEVGVGLVRGDDALDALGGGLEGVVGVGDEVDLVECVGKDDEEDDGGGDGGADEGAGAGGGAPEVIEREGDERGDGDGDDEVVPGLQVVVIGEEKEVAGCPEEERGDDGVGEQAGAPEEREHKGEEEGGVEGFAHPGAVGKGVEDDGGEGLELEAGVGVGGEEIAVVGEEVGANDEQEPAEPESESEGSNGQGYEQEGT